MASIDQLVKVQITQGTQAVAQESFSVPLIVGPTKPAGRAAGDVVRTYFAASDMLQDGYTSSSPEYVYASAIFAQQTVPTLFKVGLRSGQSAAQVDVLTVANLTAGTDLTLQVQGNQVTYTPTGSDTPQSALQALRPLIEAKAPVSGAVSGTGSNAKLTLTGNDAGTILSYAAGSGLTLTSQTAAAGIAADLAAVLQQDAGWYGLAIAQASDAEILQAASWIESNRKLYAAVSKSPEVATGSTTDVASKLQAAGFNRTFLTYSPAGYAQGVEIAWLASELAKTPGSSNWAYKSLAGITADTLSPNAQTTLIGSPIAGTRGKAANIYQSVSGVNITQMGMAASGRYLDLTHGLDWLTSQIKTNMYALLVGTVKVPYTDVGVSALVSCVRAAIDLGVANGLIDGSSPITTDAAAVATVPQNQRANRIAPPIKFSCRLQGAANAINIDGTVSV